jgi:hypothetical protein
MLIATPLYNLKSNNMRLKAMKQLEDSAMHCRKIAPAPNKIAILSFYFSLAKAKHIAMDQSIRREVLQIEDLPLRYVVGVVFLDAEQIQLP